MQSIRRHPFALLALAVAALAFTALVAQGQAAARPTWEYKVVNDLEQAEANQLGAGGWEFAGYLGTSQLGSRIDETLWRRQQ